VKSPNKDTYAEKINILGRRMDVTSRDKEEARSLEEE
jgi:hypothetical protein